MILSFFITFVIKIPLTHKVPKVDIIVMGSHGKSALSVTVLGSVSYGVIHNDKRIHVLVVRG
jgi:nucleotide-binding universal stress UspA family protein